MPGFGSWFLEKKKLRRKTRLVGALSENIQHYLSLTDIDTADRGKHFQTETEPRGTVLEMT